LIAFQGEFWIHRDYVPSQLDNRINLSSVFETVLGFEIGAWKYLFKEFFQKVFSQISPEFWSL
jgi:hypothetical protein